LLQFLHLGHAGLQSLLIESFVLLVICIQPLILVLEIQESVVEYIIVHAHSLHVLPDHVEICCALVIFRIELNISDGSFVRRKALPIFIRIDLMSVALSLATDPLNATVVHGLHHILGSLFDPLELIKDLVLVGYPRSHIVDFTDNLLTVAHKLSFPVELAWFITPEVIIASSCGVDLTLVEMVGMATKLKEVFPWLVNLCAWTLITSIVIIEICKRWIFLRNDEVLRLHI
jgi:hypothetical protein